MEYTNEQLESAYATVFEAERALVLEIETIMQEMADGLTAAGVNFPDNSNGSAAKQLLMRINMSLTNILNYDLPNVKVQYGLTND